MSQLPVADETDHQYLGADLEWPPRRDEMSDEGEMSNFTILLCLVVGAYHLRKIFCKSKPERAYRFNVGDQVLCRTGEQEWSLGEVVQLMYREQEWPRGRFVPYQVELESGSVIFVPEDNDELCRKFVWPWWTAVFNEICSRVSENPAGEVLRQRGANENVNEQDHEGCTALMAAVKLNWRNGIAELLGMRADVNMADHMRMRPLHMAAPHGDDTMKALVDAKADLNCHDIDPDSNPGFAKSTLGIRKEHRTPLHCACAEGSAAAAVVLLKARANINCQDARLKTPLHVAVEDVNSEIVDVLLRFNADANLGNQQSGLENSPLMDAAFAGHRMLVNKMIAGRADVNKQGKQRMSALHLAARGGHAEVAQALLASRADVMQESQCGTALHLARKKGGVKLFEVFGLQTETPIEVQHITSIAALDVAQRAALFLD